MVTIYYLLRMKVFRCVLTLFLMFRALSMAYGQTAVIKLPAQSTTIGSLISEIEKQTDYLVVYAPKEIAIKRPVKLSKMTGRVVDYLNEVFPAAGISFSYENGYIILKVAKENDPASGSVQTAFCHGIVKDGQGNPLIGVSIVVGGTKTGTTSAEDGSFSIRARSSDSLHLTYVGFKDKVVAADLSKTMLIQMEEDGKVLDEIVVIGYGSLKAKELTSAVSHIGSRDMLSVSSNNPIMQIQGKAAGVTISNTANADPNSSPSVQIRGVSSRNAGLGPLYVVDGITDVNMQNVNSNDIESIDILKDGAASAIYGTRGSNGVIIVTTKKGNRDGGTHVDYNGYYAIDEIYNKPNLLSASEFRDYRVPNGAPDFGASTDWFDLITQTGTTQSHAVTFSGGASKFGYRATLDSRQSEGVDIRSNRKEYGGRINIQQGSPDDFLRFTVTAAPRIVNRNFSDQGAVDIALRSNPTFPVMDADDPLLFNDFNGRLPTGPNPVETLTLVENGSETKLLDWNASTTLNLLSIFDADLPTNKTLSTQVTVSQNITDNFDFSFSPSTTSTNRFAQISGTASRAYSKAINQTLEWIGTGSIKFNRHSIDGLVGYSYNYFVNSGMGARNRNFASDALSYNNLGSGDNESKIDPVRVGMSSSKEDSKLIGFFGRAVYNYMERYMLTASLRYEGSSRFGANNKWGYFPAFSAGWRVSDEPFLKPLSWLDDLKLRGDFGVTGNQNIPNYRSLALISPFGQTFYNGNYITVVGPNSNVNPNLRWERGINWNIGADFSILKSMFSGSLNYYNRTQKDLVGDYNAPVPPNITPLIYANVGTMKNSGLEAELQWNVVKKKSFNYTMTLIGDYGSNKFVSFSNDVYKGKGYDDAAYLDLGDFGAGGMPVQRIEEGKRIGTFYMLSYAGIDQDGKWLVWNQDFSEKIRIADAKESDKHYAGNGLPAYKISMSHAVQFKQWDLAVSLRSAWDFKIYNVQDYAFSLKNAQLGYNVFRTAYTNNYYVTDGLAKPTDYFLRNGDYFKIDVVTLGYSVKVPKNRFVSSVRVYATGRNLFTQKGYKGLDPDIFPVNGLTPGVLTNTGYYPATIQVMAGLQVKFQ